MTPSLRIAVWLSTAAVGGTGLAFAVMKWCLEPVDGEALVNHAWQPAMLQLHVLAAPLWLFVFGVLWQAHALPKLRGGVRARRRSGAGLAGLAAPMAASGYLLQTAVDDAWRQTWVVAHVSASMLWLLAFVWHLASPQARPAPGGGRRGGACIGDAGR